MKKILFLAALLGTAASAMAQETVTKMVVEDVDGNVTKIETEKVRQITFVEEERLVVPTTVEEALAMMQGQWKADMDPSMLPPYADELYVEIDGDYFTAFIHVPDGCTDETYGAYAGQYVLMSLESGWAGQIVPDTEDPTKGRFGNTKYESLNSESFVLKESATYHRVETPISYVDPSAPTVVGYVEIDGVKTEVAKITVLQNGEKGFTIGMYGKDRHIVAGLDIALTFADGNTHNLTDDLTHDMWYTGIHLGSSTYWTDEGDFTSGTIKVSVSDIDTEAGTCTLNIETSGVANHEESETDEDVSFSISYSGTAEYNYANVGAGESKQRK